jgi:hypothetical protein
VGERDVRRGRREHENKIALLNTMKEMFAAAEEQRKLANALEEARKIKDRIDKANLEKAQAAAAQHRREVAIAWSRNYDHLERNWQERNITMVNGRGLTPDQVAALNAENEKRYKHNRSPQQLEDDLEEPVTGKRSHGTKGFTPLVANTNNTPRSAKPSNYVPPGER